MILNCVQFLLQKNCCSYCTFSTAWARTFISKLMHHTASQQLKNWIHSCSCVFTYSSWLYSGLCIVNKENSIIHTFIIYAIISSLPAVVNDCIDYGDSFIMLISNSLTLILEIFLYERFTNSSLMTTKNNSLSPPQFSQLGSTTFCFLLTHQVISTTFVWHQVISATFV